MLVARLSYTCLSYSTKILNLPKNGWILLPPVALSFVEKLRATEGCFLWRYVKHHSDAAEGACVSSVPERSKIAQAKAGPHAGLLSSRYLAVLASL